MTAEVAEHRINLWATILLSVAALATSWAGYQASVWSGDQAAHGGRATALRTNSTRAATRAGQASIVDVQMFLGWTAAYVHGDTLLTKFYEHRFRPEFVPAFRAWIASRPRKSTNAGPTPFALPEYKLADNAEAARLARAADEESAASQYANNQSDGYVFASVMLATVMFFATAARQGKSLPLRIVLLVIAVLMCASGVYRLVTSPLG